MQWWNWTCSIKRVSLRARPQLVSLLHTFQCLILFCIFLCRIILNFRTYNACGNEDGKLTNTAAYLAHKPPANIDLSNAQAVVAHLNTLLTADRLYPANSAMIESAYSDSYNAEGGGPEEALKVATILVVSTAEFHTNNAVALTDSPREPTPPDEKNEDEDYKVRVVCRYA